MHSLPTPQPARLDAHGATLPAAIHIAIGLLVMALVCLVFSGAYPLVAGDTIETFTFTGSVLAVSLSAALVGVVVRWRL